MMIQVVIRGGPLYRFVMKHELWVKDGLVIPD